MIKHLKELRHQKRISQQQLATALGISQQSINKYENHNIEPDISLLIAMAEYFGTSIDYLVGYAQDSENVGITEKERELIEGYRSLEPAQRTCVDTLIANYKSENQLF